MLTQRGEVLLDMQALAFLHTIVAAITDDQLVTAVFEQQVLGHLRIATAAAANQLMVVGRIIFESLLFDQPVVVVMTELQVQI